MRFVSVDLETANADMASICSIGAATYENGQLVSEWYSLVNPEDYFDPLNVSIHGIRASDVEDAPTFRRLSDDLFGLIENQIVVTHTHFDRVALLQASGSSGLQVPNCRWLDSAKVARRTWAECARSGYGLANVCKLIGFEFKHHNALEDAKAAGAVVVEAMRSKSLDLESVLSLVRQPVWGSSGKASPKPDANPDGPFAGEVIVFTGALEIPRREAEALAAQAGCEVGGGVTKKTTILVVGDIDVQRLAGHSKTSKHVKAEELLTSGQPIKIIRETDFKRMVDLS